MSMPSISTSGAVQPAVCFDVRQQAWFRGWRFPSCQGHGSWCSSLILWRVSDICDWTILGFEPVRIMHLWTCGTGAWKDRSSPGVSSGRQASGRLLVCPLVPVCSRLGHVPLLWETENYHVMWWLSVVLQSGDCCLICAQSNTIIWWENGLTAITSHDRFSLPMLEVVWTQTCAKSSAPSVLSSADVALCVGLPDVRPIILAPTCFPRCQSPRLLQMQDSQRRRRAPQRAIAMS